MERRAIQAESPPAISARKRKIEEDMALVAAAVPVYVVRTIVRKRLDPGAPAWAPYKIGSRPDSVESIGISVAVRPAKTS